MIEHPMSQSHEESREWEWEWDAMSQSTYSIFHMYKHMYKQVGGE